ncbi:MAG: three-Cys-motif partner protein TcmP [Streptosporangiaceae bacterium]
MATGTSGGLLDDAAGHAQSVFKHEILRQYMPPFISMLGSASTGKRVVVLDGYAGRGRYDDGTPASAELILQAIGSLSGTRRPAAFFAEKDRGDYARLASVVSEYAGRGVPATALFGSVEDHLDEVLAAASGVPLFMFLDPCGAGLPFDRLTSVLSGSRRLARPQTEVLLNFSADLSRRTAGVLNAGQADHPGVALMDKTCGGQWWREASLTALRGSAAGSFEPVTAAVADGYAARLAAAGSMLHVTVPVRRRLNHQPIYHLVFMTRSRYGLWVFADAIGKARKAWLRRLGAADDDDAAGMLFTPADDMEWLIDSEAERATQTVAANLRGLIARNGRVRLVDHALGVFGDAYGVATDSAVAAAVNRLVAAGELAIYTKAKQVRDRVVGRPGT